MDVVSHIRVFELVDFIPKLLDALLRFSNESSGRANSNIEIRVLDKLSLSEVFVIVELDTKLCNSLVLLDDLFVEVENM